MQYCEYCAESFIGNKVLFIYAGVCLYSLFIDRIMEEL